MIPKIIHYCWFGGKPLPSFAKKCIASWKKYLPDYEIKEWNESNFDVNSIPYTASAYKMKKYAFVSDYVRLYVISQYGGIYFDTDVEVVKPLDDIIEKGAFLGTEKNINVFGELLPGINPGLGFGAPPHHPLLVELVDMYHNVTFTCGEGESYGFKTIVYYTTELMYKYGYRGFMHNREEILSVCDTYIYPKRYFCPDLVDNKWTVLDDTRSIHHYAATWLPLVSLLKTRLVRSSPVWLHRLYTRIFKN